MKLLFSITLVLVLVTGSYSWPSLRGIFSHIMGSKAKHTHQQETNEVVKMENWVKPPFCNELDCPKYQRLASKEGYEIRKYAKSGWVSTNMLDMSYGQSSYKMFRKLFNYIQRGNVAAAKIPMTAPVTMRIIPGQGPACEQNFTMSFFVAGDFSAAPKPNATDVFLNQTPEVVAYVRQFDGYAMSFSTWRTQALALAKAINDSSLYHQNFYYTAGYNSPFQIVNRHNEVWFIKK
ncbi:heme-binding protein 2-like [Lineus longissimus]|uniref:heme-binding protein 2-like n=1 Tax=Lineus longissimus TaxID=88925 RepID=UPI002B4EDBE4